MAAVTSEQAIASLQAAIEFGQIAVQQAPGGHPLYAAMAEAQETIDYLRDNVGIIPQPINDGTRVHQMIDQSIEAIMAAGASLRVANPDQPLPRTIWPQVQTLPWPWIAAGVGALVVVAVLFQQQSRR